MTVVRYSETEIDLERIIYDESKEAFKEYKRFMSLIKKYDGNTQYEQIRELKNFIKKTNVMMKHGVLDDL
jgi:uncharacterized protein YijF (DUF1287 family)